MKFLNSIKKKLRLSIFRSNKHIYAQITDDFNCKTLVSCSSLEKSFKKLFSNKNNSENAWIIGRTLAERSLNKKIQKVTEMFMVDYFNKNPNDLLEKLNGINYTLEEMRQFYEIPRCNYAGGVVVYYSKLSCQLLINHLESINWNVFTKDEQFGYPYIIEDIGLGFILNNKNIYPTSYNLYSNNSIDKDTLHTETFAFHTNKYK